MRRLWRELGWVVILTGLIGWFFQASIFRNHTLVPADLLSNLILPFDAAVKHIQVQNHYTMDALCQDYPWNWFWQQSVRHGEWPLWDPYFFGGTPHLATSMAAVFNPFKGLLLLMSVERAMTWGIILSFWTAAIGVFALLRRIGRSPAAALIGAGTYALSSAMLMWYWRLPLVFAWVPLVLLGFEQSQQSGRRTGALLGGLALGIAYVSGNAQAAVHTSVICLFYFAGAIDWQDGVARRRGLFNIVLLTVIGLLLAAIQWIPTLELMALDGQGRIATAGPRPGLRHSVGGICALLTLIFPTLTGTCESFDLLRAAGLSRADFTGYIGLVPWLLFCVAALAGRDRRVRWQLGAIAMVVAVLFLTPLVKYLYHRFLIVVVFAASLIAATGTDIVLEAVAEKRALINRVFRTAVILSVLILVGVGCIQFVVHQRRAQIIDRARTYVMKESAKYSFGDRPDWLLERIGLLLDNYRVSNPQIWVPVLLLLVGASGWWAYSRRWLPRAGFAGVLVACSLLDLFVLGRPLVPQVDQALFPLCPPHPIINKMQEEAHGARFRQTGPGFYFLFRPNLSLVYGLTSAWGSESLAPANLENLPFEKDGQFTRLLDLQNVKYVLTPGETTLPGPRFMELAAQDGIHLFENRDCLPRATFHTRWRVIPDHQAVRTAMNAADFDPAREVLVEQSLPTEPSGGVEPPVAITESNPQQVSLSVSAPQPGLLLLADTYYPGWQARMDGQPVTVYRADYALRAVIVPTGTHAIEFTYRPLSFRWGAVISAITLTGTLLWVGLSLYTGGNERKPQPGRARPSSAAV